MVPACRCCTTVCSTSSVKKSSSGVSRLSVVRSIYLPWYTRAPLSLHSVGAGGCNNWDSAASLSTCLLLSLSLVPLAFILGVCTSVQIRLVETVAAVEAWIQCGHN